MPRAYLLDLTRLTSRMGRGVLTGIDRVEAAYLTHFLAQDSPIFGLVRTRRGYLLLDRHGCAALSDLAQGRVLPDLPYWMRPFVMPAALGTVALRPLAVARRPAMMLSSLLRQLPKNAHYINVGHSNLSNPLLATMRLAGLRSAVMVHDTIPLDFPQFARAGTVPAFATKITATAHGADCVIHISQDARTGTEAHFAKAGRVPFGITAHLGVTVAPPMPAPFTPLRPYFVALGTIEPRKNLRLLLDIWQDAPRWPSIGGHRGQGWADQALFAQIAQLQAKGAVLHGENLPDGAVTTLLRGAIALLFPSLAEGFGLPPCEAMALGVPVIASDLPVLRETCTSYPIYLNASDSYSWMETIQTLAQTPRLGHGKRMQQPLPTWADHFNIVLTQLT